MRAGASGRGTRWGRSVLAGVLVSTVVLGLAALMLWMQQDRSAERERQDRDCLISVASHLVAAGQGSGRALRLDSDATSSCAVGAAERIVVSTSPEGWVLAIGPTRPQRAGLEERLCQPAVMTVVRSGEEMGLCWRGQTALEQRAPQ